MNITYTSHKEAVKLVENGNRVFIQGSAATPVSLVNALLDRAEELNNVELTAITTYGKINWNRPEVLKSFYLNSLFVSENVRGWANSNHGNFIPVFLSEIPSLFEKGILPIDVALIHVSPPDTHGYCTLGTSTDIALSAVRIAKKVVAQINPQMPRVLGSGIIHISKFDACVYEDSPLPEVNYGEKTDEATNKIGQLVASLINDRDTLQMGIGTIPDATLKNLYHHKDLGIHTEMFSDGVVDLFNKGAISNAYKKIQPGKILSSFLLGTKKLYDFVNDNPIVSLRESSFVNDVYTISRNDNMVAINSAIEIDLTGQVCADSIGTYQYSGIGGQMDFMRGAARSNGGKPIIAMRSTTGKGISRIVPQLKDGAGVVTTRGHIHYVVTEYGIVNLYGKNLEQRSELLISIAHPEHREALAQAHYERFKCLVKGI